MTKNKDFLTVIVGLALIGFVLDRGGFDGVLSTAFRVVRPHAVLLTIVGLVLCLGVYLIHRRASPQFVMGTLLVGAVAVFLGFGSLMM